MVYYERDSLALTIGFRASGFRSQVEQFTLLFIHPAPDLYNVGDTYVVRQL